MITIAHIVEATATGTLSMVCASANTSAEHGAVVHVIYSLRPETPDNLSELFHKNVKLHHISMAPRSGIAALFKLRHKLKCLGPDIVHLHSSLAGFLGRAALLGSLPRTRVFYSPHCISVMRKDIHKRAYLFAMLERTATLRHATYLACSQSERDAIQKWIGVDALVLENAVDTTDYPQRNSPETLRPADKPLIIVTVGGIRPQKNPSLFAEIAKLCALSNIDARFIWIGDGDQKLSEELQTAGVEITGWKPRRDIYRALCTSDLYISTARWEGLPVSLIEAMCSGVPILATKCSGNIDVITHKRTGLLFESATDGARLVQQVATGKIDVNRLADNASAEAHTRFSTQRFSEQLLAMYNSFQPISPGTRPSNGH